jgi:hypothetical protein
MLGHRLAVRFLLRARVAQLLLQPARAPFRAATEPRRHEADGEARDEDCGTETYPEPRVDCDVHERYLPNFGTAG